jgi:lysophospholipase L1-like esterase
MDWTSGGLAARTESLATLIRGNDTDLNEEKVDWKNMLRPCFMIFAAAILLASFAAAQESSNDAPAFFLKDGDRVVFYGDSITEQKLYTSDIEEFVLTRFPQWRVGFVHSGVGGDKVSGSWTGPIDLRLDRDVFPYQPTVVTIMLGMNDGFYRAYEPSIFESYADGYRHLLDAIRTKAPTAHITLLQPSPYDDVTRDPKFEGGYNGVLQRFSAFVSQLSTEKHTTIVDLNTPVVAALTKAKALDAALSTGLIADRVHPGAGIHWLMAEAVLKAWGAPAVVTSVSLDAAKMVSTESSNTRITELQKDKTTKILNWLQTDNSLPLPLASSNSDPFLDLVIRSSDLVEALDQETLRVIGLARGSYRLTVDRTNIGDFTADQLSIGINLAVLETPMRAQARLLALDTEEKNEIAGARFALIRDAMDSVSQQTATELAAAHDRAVEQQRKDAQPVPHRYTLTPAEASQR